MHALLQDLRYSLRQLIKSPAFALTAVISLALGIGATTAVFSVVYGGLLHPYPYRAADRIVPLKISDKQGEVTGVNPNGPQIQALQQVPIIESVLITGHHAMNLKGNEFPESVSVTTLSGNTFSDLGVPPLLGRGLLSSDAVEGQGAQPVAVISYKFWQEHFFADPDVLGRTLQLDYQNYQIVGIAAPRFKWGGDVYLPLQMTQDPAETFTVWLRLKPGVTYVAASAALQPVVEQFAADMPKHFPEHFKVHIESLNAWAFRRIGGTLYLMLGAVMLLLAIGCGNVSILLLARGTARQHELAVRAAIGAARGRIVRQLLTESLLLAATGAVLGILASYGILAGIHLLLPPYALPEEAVIRINLPVLFFSVGVALVTGVLFGLWPALQLSRTQVGEIMQSNTRRMTGSIRARRTHSLLIAAQIALTLLLLAAAGSAMKTFVAMLHRPLGYDPDHVMALQIPLRDNSYTTWATRAAYFEQLRAKVAETPGVTTAAISVFSNPPRSGWDARFEILGKPLGEPQTAYVHLVSPEYFAALRIPLLQGRVWTAAENHNAAPVAMINRTFAQRFFLNGDALEHSGKLTLVEDSQILSAPTFANSWLPIVGVVDDFVDDGLSNPIRPAIFVPYTVALPPGVQMLVRTAAPPLTLLHSIQTQLVGLNPDQQIRGGTEELAKWISNGPEWQREHTAAWIFGIFAWLALALAAVGLYSVVSYMVAQRTNEFGIRMALGAQGRDLLRIVFASTLTSVGCGIAAGVALSAALGTILAKWVEGNVRDPMILLAGVLLLALVAGIACAIPARRASDIDPMMALRCE
jgi:predicted permease